MALVIDAATCAKRLKALYAAWRADAEGWGGAKALAIARGPAAQDEDELRYLKSVALHQWLFGYEVPDTVLLFTPEALHVVASAKKADVLRPVAAPVKAEAGVDLVFHEKPKGADGGEQLDALLALARSAGSPLGVLAREKPDGALSDLWAARTADVERADVAPALARLMAPKDDVELTATRRAAHLSASVLEKFLLDKIVSVVDEEGKIKHSALADKTMDAASDPAKEPVSVKLKPENVEICYPFIVQSGGDYDLRWSAGSNDKSLSYEPTGVIVCQLGCRYKSYCSNVGRTYLIDPPKAVNAAYEALLAAHGAAIGALREGARCCDVYAAAAAALAAAPGGDALAAHLTKTLGAAMGLEFRESALQLGPKCEARIAAGTVFNLSTGLSDLVNERAKEGARDRNYALLLADTVLVKPGGEAADVLTNAKSALSDISYEINEQAEEEEKKPAVARAGGSGAGAGAVLNAKMRSDAAGPTAEARRKAAQDELAAKKNEETLRRLTDAKQRNAAAASSSGAAADFVAYRAPADVPSDRAREAVIVVDRPKEAVLLPIYGQLVPFHIGTIKNCTATQEGVAHFIRIHFNVPGVAFGGVGYAPGAANPDATFLREITFRSSDGRHASNIVSEIKSLRTAAKQRVTEAAERATLVRQDKLKLAQGRVHRLADVWVRPTFGGRGRKLSGTLECHANGFRYSTPKSEERLDIIFSNIKHAFFQPSEKELITLIHFHLVEPIMVGKKKTHDVQVFAEVMDAVQSLDGGRRSMYDPDEIEDEQRERERRNRVNADFAAFTKRVQELWNRDFADLDLEFDIPFRELAFPGVPYKTSSLVLPTVNCLVDLIETPFLVVTLKEIEVVNLERVGFALKNFDMAIVFKDFTKEVHRIDAIDVKNLDTIKEWLNSVGIKYYESKMNLNWKPILKTILDDPNKFVEDGGWDFLDLEKSDDEDEDEEESDGAPSSCIPAAPPIVSDACSRAGYVPTDGDSGGEEDEEESSEEESVEDSDEDASDFDEEDEEEEGKDWDELEKEALRDDKKSYEEESDGEAGRKRKGGGGGGGGGGSKSKPPPSKKSKY